jgi:hypothetical protein
MACERARGGQCIAWQSIAGALASAGPKLRKILFRPGFLNRVWADTPKLPKVVVLPPRAQISIK